MEGLEEKEHYVLLIKKDYLFDLSKDPYMEDEMTVIKWGFAYSSLVELVGYILYNFGKEKVDAKSAGEVIQKLNHPLTNDVDYKVRNSIQHLDFTIEKEYIELKTLKGISKIDKKELPKYIDNIEKTVIELKKLFKIIK